MDKPRGRALTAFVLFALVACMDPSASSTTQTVTLPETTIPTTTSPATPPTMGLVGCSMTVDAAEGMRTAGASYVWGIRGLGYGGGSIARWSNPRDPRGLWERFDAALAAEPETEAIWWQLCTSGAEDDNFDRALAVLSEIESRVPEAAIYVSAQPGYEDGHVCSSAGPDGPRLMQDVADKLVETGRVQAGPVLPPLRSDHLVDDCHAGPEGKEQMAQAIDGFFAGVLADDAGAGG